jgi:hypothetical protein
VKWGGKIDLWAALTICIIGEAPSFVPAITFQLVGKPIMLDLISYSNFKEPLPCGGNKGSLLLAGCGSVPIEQGCPSDSVGIILPYILGIIAVAQGVCKMRYVKFVGEKHIRVFSGRCMNPVTEKWFVESELTKNWGNCMKSLIW